LDEQSRYFQEFYKPAAKSSGGLALILRHIGRDGRDRNWMENVMLKFFAICAALISLATDPAGAQQIQQEAVLQKVEVPGARFDIIVAKPKLPRSTINLGNSPDALVMHLVGGELVLSFDAEEKMLTALEFLRSPACAFQVDGLNGKDNVAAYLVPKGASLTSATR
jgi:hypothetical protein